MTLTIENIKHRLAIDEPMTDDDVLFVLQEQGAALKDCYNSMKSMTIW